MKAATPNATLPKPRRSRRRPVEPARPALELPVPLPERAQEVEPEHEAEKSQRGAVLIDFYI